MNDFIWNLKQVADDIPHGAIRLHAATSFYWPHDGIWPEPPVSFPELANNICASLSEQQRLQFLSACLASFLLNPSKAPGRFKKWLLELTTIQILVGLDLTLEQLIGCHWGRVAIPLADPSEGNRELVVYALAGASRTSMRLPLFPVRYRSTLNNAAQDTVSICAGLITKRFPDCSFHFWPIANTTVDSCLINGTSLGLPVYLAFYSLANGCTVPNILATGTVQRDGTLKEVAYLDEKFRLAGQKGFSTFIYPHFSGIKPLQQTGKVEPVGVATLQQAERIWGRQSHSTNFVAYLEKVKSNFRERIGRFVHLKGHEEITLLNSYAVEQLPDTEEDNELIGRRGTIDELRDKYVMERRMMLWGDAGMGKSTTLEYLAYRDADKKLKESDGPIPVYLPLGLLTDRNLSLKKIIWNRIGVDDIAGESLLLDGKINLFLDGVNEIPRDSNNTLINTRIREIQELIDDYPASFIMVSNRQQSENIFHNIPVFIMQRMDQEQMLVFIQKNSNNTALASMIHAELDQNKRLVRIVKTPLMLSRLIEVVRDEGTIPKSEGEIIHRFINCLYNRERVEKKDMNFDISKIHRLLRYLGYESLEDLNTNAGMSEDQVLFYFVACMNKYNFNIDTMYVIDKANQLNILDKRDNLYTFAHQAYQDYYHSQELLHSFDVDKARL
jgi:uncharacterized tellurite resistance protein B-like protein